MKTMKLDLNATLATVMNIVKIADYRLSKNWNADREIKTAKQLAEICEILEKEKTITLIIE